MKTPWIDCHTHVGVDPAFYVRGELPYAQDYRNLVGQAAQHGVQRLITFPFVSYFGWEGLEISAPARGADFSVPYAFENRRMMEEIFEWNSDLAPAAIPFVIVDPARRPLEQIEALRALRDRYPICGFKIQPTMIESPIRSLGGEGRGLVDLAAEWDIPILIHSSIAPEDIWSQAGDILDVAEARPDVRFCLAHSCRFHLPSLERLGRLSNTWFDCSAHVIHCEAAMQDLRIIATPDQRLPADYARPEAVLKSLLDLLPDRMLWGTDTPFHSYAGRHPGGTLKLFSSYRREVAALTLLTDREKTAILHDNTLQFLGVDHV